MNEISILRAEQLDIQKKNAALPKFYVEAQKKNVPAL